MTLAVTFSSVLLAFHLLSAFAFGASMVLFTYLIVRSRNVDTPGPTIAMVPAVGVSRKVVIVGGIGTLVFGIWLAIRLDHVQVWSGWVIAAIVLWIVALATGQRSGVEFDRALTKAGELESAGQPGANAELLALNRSSRGLTLHLVATLAVFLILIDMIWKPGASDIVAFRPDSWNVAAPDPHHRSDDPRRRECWAPPRRSRWRAATWARSSSVTTRSCSSPFPALVLTKIGATAIWSKESSHSLIGAAFPHTDDPRWIMVGGTALDGGAGLLVLALILGWFGLRRMEGGESDFLTKVPVVKNMSGETLVKATTIISVVLLVGYALAIWAMSTKPS